MSWSIRSLSHEPFIFSMTPSVDLSELDQELRDAGTSSPAYRPH